MGSASQPDPRAVSALESQDSSERHSIVFPLGGAHTGDLLLALPAIGAALQERDVVVSGLEPRYYAALRHLPVVFRHASPAGIVLRPTWQVGTHRTDGWLDALGLPPVRMPLPLRGLAPARNLLPDAPWALLSPWADFASKRWPTEAWCALADTLQALGLRVAVIGPPSARTMADAIAAHAHLNLVGWDTPETWPALLTRAAIVISTDTACVHMADALGIPVVGLYGHTRIDEYGPYWRREHCVQAAGMKAIGVDAVMAAVRATGALPRRVDPSPP